MWRSAISVIADWPIFISRIYRNAPYKKNHLFFEYLDVAFRYSRYSGLAHQNVKIKYKCNCTHFADFSIWILVDFFNAFEHIINPPSPCTVFAEFWDLGFYRQGEYVQVWQRGQWYTLQGGWRKLLIVGITKYIHRLLENHSGCPVVQIGSSLTSCLLSLAAQFITACSLKYTTTKFTFLYEVYGQWSNCFLGLVW